MPFETSYPKNKIKVLLLENIHSDARHRFEQENYQIETLSASLSSEELAEKIKDKHILGIRSKTQIDKTVLQSAQKLWAIGTFCIGTNQVDLNTCLEKGIIVFNAPYSNTRSVVELTIGEIIALMRNLCGKNNALHQGQWQKSAQDCYEVRGKKLGIIGYGNIGSQLSILAEALGLEVYYYDIVEKLALGNAKKCNSMKELLQIADIITVHVDGREENKNLFGFDEFMLMKKGSYFLNLSRGFVVDLSALAEALKLGHIKGAAIDVFPSEPKGNSDPFSNELQHLPNVILTPHVGGSTLEAQKNIADFVSMQIIHYINSGDSLMSVNFPEIKLPSFKNAHRMIHIHHNVPGVLAYMNELFASFDINILGQYLKTNETMGYVITDISKKYNRGIIDKIKAYQNTIRFRVLY